MRKLGTRLTLALVVGAVLAWWASPICPSAYLFHGLAVATCPDGRPALEVEVYGQDLRRGGEGLVGVHASGVFATSPFDTVGTRAPVFRVRARYTLVDPDGVVLPLSPARSQSGVPDDATRVLVPTGRDGDYTLRAEVTTPLGEQTAEVKIPLAPAGQVGGGETGGGHAAGGVVEQDPVGLLDGMDARPPRFEERPQRRIDPAGAERRHRQGRGEVSFGGR